MPQKRSGSQNHCGPRALLGAAACAAMAFAGTVTVTVTAKIIWLLLAAVRLILIYPLYQIGNLAEGSASKRKS